MSAAIRQGFKLPVPIPNACPARREVCASVVPNDAKRSPCRPFSNRSSGRAGNKRTYSIVKHEVL